MKSKKTAFYMSLLSLLLCVAMLVGTTFAWFTDTVTSGTNRIQAGNLDVDLLMYKDGSYTSIALGSGDIFAEASVAQNSSATLWEPGKTQVVFLAVQNKGSLAVKYNAYIDVTDEGLIGSLEYAWLGGVDKTTYDAVGATRWSDIETYVAGHTDTSTQGDLEDGRTTITTGVLDEIVNGTPDECDYVALAVHMKEEADNTYQGKDAIIDITIVATQKDAESDSFGTDYDKNATIEDPAIPVHISVETDTGVKEETGDTLTFTASGDVIGASLATDSAKELFTSEESTDASKDMLLNLNVDTTETTSTSVTYDLTLYKTITTTVEGVTTNGEATKVTETLSTYLTAQIQLASGLKNVVVTHSGSAMEELASAGATPTNENGGYYYDTDSGVLTIQSKSFSPFKVVYEVDEDAEVKITKDGKVIGYTSFVDFKQMILDVDTYDNFWGYTVTLLKDVDLSNADMDLFRVNSSEIFAGTFDGDNHSISGFNNICTDEDMKYASLFYYLYNATIENLIIKDSTFDYADHASSFLAYQAYGDTLVLDNVHLINCDITHGFVNQFFIFAPSSDVTTIKNCSTDATSSMDCIYGNYGCWFRQVCYTDFNMIDCVNNAPMRGRGFVGAFVGQLGTNVYTASFTNCINNGDITVYETSSANGRMLYGGGFIGYKNSSVNDNTIPQTITFTNCESNGDIIVEDVDGNTGFNGGAVGGYIGYTNGTTLIFNNCKSNGNIGSSLIQRAAGFVGWENGTSTITFTGCEQTGSITSNSTNGISGVYVAANNGTTNMSTVTSTATGEISGKTITKITGEE